MSTPLDPTGLSITVGDIRLTTPGLRGLADVHSPASPGSRAAEDASQGLLDGLALGGMEESVTIEISDTAELDGGGGTRGVADESAMIVDVPAPGEAYGQVVLYKSEDGAFSWHLPESTDAGATRGAAHLQYRILALCLRSIRPRASRRRAVCSAPSGTSCSRCSSSRCSIRSSAPSPPISSHNGSPLTDAPGCGL